jgi:hypothetical protein
MAGLIENKLLMHDLLQHVMKLPTVPILYGGFKSRALGQWPQYSRTAFVQHMERIFANRKRNHSFVVKPITGMMSECVTVVNERKWQRQKWDMNDMADKIDECIMQQEYSNANMHYEHVGVVVQENVIANSDRRWLNIDSKKRRSGFQEHFHSNDARSLFEFKAHVVFGELCGARINPVPMNHKAFVDINLCHYNDKGEAEFRFASGVFGATVANVWDKVRPVLMDKLPTIQDMARTIYHTLAIDHYRLDVFMDTAGSLLVVNEVTYPSFSIFEFDCTNDRLMEAYGNENDTKLKIIPARSLLQSLLDEIGVDADTFLNEPDFNYLKLRWTEEEEDDSYFGRWTGNRTEDKDRNTDYDEVDFSAEWKDYTLA